LSSRNSVTLSVQNKFALGFAHSSYASKKGKNRRTENLLKNKNKIIKSADSSNNDDCPDK
jgi:hypothetical protein